MNALKLGAPVNPVPTAASNSFNALSQNSNGLSTGSEGYQSRAAAFAQALADENIGNVFNILA